jgi:uncharacterized protein
MLPAFSENAIRADLASLSWPEALAFAAACVERIVPNYERFSRETGWGDPRSIGHALDVIWQATQTVSRVDEATLRQCLADCEAAVPESEDFHSLFTSGAQDAVFAVCSLLEFLLDGSLDRLVLAARYPTDSVDLYVQELEGMTPQDPLIENRILSHHLMQQELARQQRDLDLLRRRGMDAIRGIREAAAVERAFEMIN